MHKFIVTHKPVEWTIPFEHQLVTVNGYKQDGAIDASDTIGELNLDKTFAIYGGIAAILEHIKDLPDDDHIVVSGYRCYFGSTLQNNVNISVPENLSNTHDSDLVFREILTPEQLQLNWTEKVLLEFPKEYELVISRPINLYQSVIKQHSTTHHFDDFLFGLAEAVRAGILNPHITADLLSQPIHLAQFVSSVSFFKNLYERLWWLCKQLYTKHYVPRTGYQVRSINFTIERIVSLYLLQKVYVERVPTVCAQLLHIDSNLIYRPNI
jgi:hypothetical protein